MNSNRSNVAFVIGAMTTGGTERQLLGILKQLDRSRFQPHLFTFYSHGELNSEVPDDVIRFCDQDENEDQQPSYLLTRLPGSKQRRLAASLRRYCQRRKIDVVYDRTYHVSLVTGVACKSINVPYISTIVSDPFTDFLPTAGPFAPLKYLRLRTIYKRAYRVLCVSDALRQSAARFYRLPLETFVTCHSFIDDTRLNSIRRVREQRSTRETTVGDSLGSQTRPLRIVAIGRLHPQKGIAVLIETIGILVKQYAIECQLTVVGDGPERDSLIQQTQSLELEERVQFVGTQENPLEWLDSADVYCLPSLGEGMPNSLIEALLVGVPSIATDCQHGPSEITESGRWADLVTPGDPEAMAEALSSFVRNPERLRQTALEASDSLLERYSANAGLKQLETHLESAVQSLRR